MSIYLVDYDEAWPGLFSDEKDRICGALAGRRAVVEHIGSTAIPGIAAKPIIDIMVLVESVADQLPFWTFGAECIRTGFVFLTRNKKVGVDGQDIRGY